MRSPITRTTEGTVSWMPQAGDVYEVTGITTDGRRFRPIITGSWRYASGINLYKGSVWLRRDGRRFRILSTSN